MKPFFSIQNCLSLEQIKHIDQLENNLETLYHTGHYTDRGQALGLSKEKDMPGHILNEIYDIIKDKVEENVGTLSAMSRAKVFMYPTYGVFSRSVMPMTEHIDIDKSHIDYNKSPGYSILIPLRSNYKESTVVWNAVKKDIDLDVNPENLDILEDPDYTYTKDENDLTSHCVHTKSNLVGKPYVFEHTPGDVILWNRKYVHASSNSSNYDYILDTKHMTPELNNLDANPGSFKTLDKVVKRFALLLTRFER